MKILFIALAALAAALIAVLLILFFLTVTCCLSYDSRDNSLFVTLKVLFIKIPVYPPKPPKKPKRLSLENELKKRNEKEKKSRKNKKQSPLSVFHKELSGVAKAANIGKAISSHHRSEKQNDSTFSQKARNIASFIRITAARARAFLPSFADSIKLSVKELHITVGGKDAADTAVGYGLVCGALETLYAVSHEASHFEIGDDASVNADFCADRCSLKAAVKLDVRVFKLISALYLAENAYYGEKYR